MVGLYPIAWALLTLPFLSSLAVRSVPALRRLATKMNRLTMPVGILGLAVLAAGLLGLLPKPYALPLAVIGGVVSGYSVFSLPRSDSDGGDWRGSGPPPDDPPPPPFPHEPLDWNEFDRLRASWEHPLVREH
jgi:hypothetical protein